MMLAATAILQLVQRSFDSDILEKINELSLPGVAFKALKYRPSGTIYQNRVPRYDGQSCSGIQLILKDRNLFNPLLTVTSLMLLIEQLT